jgi:hypothetical protein
MTYGVHAAAKGIFQAIRSDTNHGSLLKNTTYTGPPRLRYFQVVPTQTTAAHCTIGKIFYGYISHLVISFSTETKRYFFIS